MVLPLHTHLQPANECRKPSAPPSLLDLPESVLSRICAYLARRPLFAPLDAPHQQLPYDLLSLAETCHSLRRLAATVCRSFVFEPYVSWRSFSAWLHFASCTASIRALRIRPIPTQLDLPFRQNQLLSPVVVLSSLAYHPFPLRVLDLSGLNLVYHHDALLLASLLCSLRTTLTSLTILDASSAFPHVVDAIVDARLHHLTSFSYLSLRADCRSGLLRIFTSFHFLPFRSLPQPSHLTQQTQLHTVSNLTHLRLQIQEPHHGTTFTNDNFLASLCPNLTHFTFGSEFEAPLALPHTFVNTFPTLRVLTLNDLILDHRNVHTVLASLPDLIQLNLDSCLILHDEENLFHAVSEPFLQLVTECVPVLTSLWLPSRYFSVPELHHLTETAPPLHSLALTISHSSLYALPDLCRALSPTLQTLRLAVLNDEGSFSPLNDDDQHHILTAIRWAQSLSSLHLVSVHLSISVIHDVLKHLGNHLTAFYTEVNPQDSGDAQFEHTVQLLDVVAKFSHGLNFFCIENELPHEVPFASEKASRLTIAVDKVLHMTPFLNSINLRSLLSVWIAHEQQPVEQNNGIVANGGGGIVSGSAMVVADSAITSVGT